MNHNLLTDLVRIARVGANALGQTASPETMQQVWAVIAEGEKQVVASAEQAAPALAD
jgi:hypothetical protein